MHNPFAVASHSYFLVRNKEPQRKAFLAGKIENPIFTYAKIYDKATVESRLQAVESTVPARQSLELVRASLELNEAQSETSLQQFRELNEALFATPRKAYVDAIIQRATTMVNDNTKELWQYIHERYDYEVPPSGAITIPDEATFQLYRSYFAKYDKAGLLTEKSASIDELFMSTLARTGLADKGWRIKYTSDEAHARVDHLEKRIYIGKKFTPRHRSSHKRIVAHEIYGHAMRGMQPSVAEAEGVALLVEQLLDETFKPRRMFRYVAAALGWGVDGRPRTFREVHEILWRLMVIMANYPHDKAAQHAFDECVRVFRGGVADLAGAVYLKDLIYFDANIAVWKKLIQSPLSFEEFVDIMEGRKRVLT